MRQGHEVHDEVDQVIGYQRGRVMVMVREWEREEAGVQPKV